MTKLNQKVQGSFATHVFKCYCGEHKFLEVMQDPVHKEIYISITMYHESLFERIKMAWQCLRGLDSVMVAGDVILDQDDIRKLIESLEYYSGGSDNEK